MTPVIHDDCGVGEKQRCVRDVVDGAETPQRKRLPELLARGRGHEPRPGARSRSHDGAMQLMRTPCGAKSTARCRVSITMPALAAAYATEAPPGCRPAVDDIVTMDPRRRSIMPSAKVRTVMYVAVRLVSMTSRHRVASSFADGFGASVATGKREEDRRRPERGLGAGTQRVDVLLVGAVGRDADGTATAGGDRCHHRVERSPITP